MVFCHGERGQQQPRRASAQRRRQRTDQLPASATHTLLVEDHFLISRACCVGSCTGCCGLVDAPCIPEPRAVVNCAPSAQPGGLDLPPSATWCPIMASTICCLLLKGYWWMHSRRHLMHGSAREDDAVDVYYVFARTCATDLQYFCSQRSCTAVHIPGLCMLLKDSKLIFFRPSVL